MPPRKLLVWSLATCVFLSAAGCQPAKPPAQAVAPSPKVPPPPLVAIGQASEYVVQEGDLGFWGIAERVYGAGNGRHWTVIAKANPAVAAGALRPGTKLKIPPLPGGTMRESPRWDPADPRTYPGGTETAPVQVTPLGGTIQPLPRKANP